MDTAHAVPLGSAWLAMERGHAEALAPMVRGVMADAGVEFKALNRIIVTTGPGTFTGVRIGLSMARGLGLALNIPVIGIDSLSAIAANQNQDVLVVADARKNEVYASLFGASPAVMSIDACLGMLPSGPITILGSGADLLMARGDFIRSHAGDLPVAANFIKRGLGAPPPGTPEPLYLRAPDAKPQPHAQRPPLAITIHETSDAEMLAALHAECFDNPWAPAACAKLMAMPGAATFVAFKAEEPVGFLLLRRAADEAEIITLGTRPFAQRRGVAKSLINRCHGMKHLFIEVAASNTAARALYAACGFAEAGLRRGYYARGADAIIMRRDVSC